MPRSPLPTDQRSIFVRSNQSGDSHNAGWILGRCHPTLARHSANGLPFLVVICWPSLHTANNAQRWRNLQWWSHEFGLMWDGPQQAGEIDTMSGWCWTSVVDAGTTLTRHCANVSCLLGRHRQKYYSTATSAGIVRGKNWNIHLNPLKKLVVEIIAFSSTSASLETYSGWWHRIRLEYFF